MFELLVYLLGCCISLLFMSVATRSIGDALNKSDGVWIVFFFSLSWVGFLLLLLVFIAHTVVAGGRVSDGIDALFKERKFFWDKEE